MRRKYFILIIVCGIVLGLASLSFSETDKKKKEDLFRQVELFSDALAIIQSDYVDEISAKDMIYGALKGMLSALDPHSQFMDPDTYNELKVDTEGKFGGLGIEITIKDGLLTVITAIEDTPAWNAGIKANDRIVKINEEITRDMSLIQAVKKMRGRPGEPVTLTILRESEKKVLEFKIIRDIIKIKDIKDVKILEDKIGYIKLVEFSENTDKDLDTALESLNQQGMNALILDLRNNPGGLLDSAVKVSERFIEPGKMIVYTKSRKANQNLEFISRLVKPVVKLPMVVLINEGSASGSEIVAGCLQDYKRAIIIGTKSFGKGSVQTVMPMSDGSALRLTTSKYFTPLGRQIHGEGVHPDIAVEDGKTQIQTVEKPETEKIKEVFEKIEPPEVNEEKKDKPAEYKADNQLSRSVDVLKAIRIYNE